MKTKDQLTLFLAAIAVILCYYEEPPSFSYSGTTEVSSKKLNSAQLQYFAEVAFGSEYEGEDTIKKWKQDIKIKVVGSPTPGDQRVLEAVIGEINALISPVITLSIVEDDANLTIHFAAIAEFPSIEPNYKSNNYGFCWVGWENDVINKARILISTTGVTQKERSHLIREELTQALGLLRDSAKYPESIFFIDWSDTTQYSELDKALIKLLYREDIKPGMSKAEVFPLLK